jgi:hypothetical protein
MEQLHFQIYNLHRTYYITVSIPFYLISLKIMLYETNYKKQEQNISPYKYLCEERDPSLLKLT